jgi:hypothetical protein
VTEAEIHRAVIEHIELRGAAGLVYFHVPNAPRSAIAGRKLKDLGMRAGVSDLIMVHQGCVYALEIKAEGGHLSQPQRQFLADFQHAGGRTAVCRGLDEALSTLRKWRLIT